MGKVAKKNSEKQNVTKLHRIINPKEQAISPRLLPIHQASKWLGLTEWGIRERIWEGQLPVVQFVDGGKMWLDVKDLESFIQKHKRVIQ